MSGYYPPANFHFSVTLLPRSLSSVDAAFSEVSGMDAEREAIPIKEGGENRFVHQAPGRLKPGKLSMKRGLLATESAMFNWCKDTLESDLAVTIQPKDLVIGLLDQSGEEVMVWRVSNAWPVKWSIAALNAQENKVAMETLEFAYASLQRAIAKDIGASGTFKP